MPITTEMLSPTTSSHLPIWLPSHPTSLRHWKLSISNLNSSRHTSSTQVLVLLVNLSASTEKSPLHHLSTYPIFLPSKPKPKLFLFSPQLHIPEIREVTPQKAPGCSTLNHLHLSCKGSKKDPPIPSSYSNDQKHAKILVHVIS